MKDRISNLRTAATFSGLLSLILATSVFCASAQSAVHKQVPPATNAKLVRVRIVHTGGMCGGSGYCTNLTTIEPLVIISEDNQAINKEKFPDRKVRTAITNREWKNVSGSIDRKAIEALSQPPECQACIDLPESWVELEYGDGSRITASYDPTNPPAPLAAVLRQITLIRQKYATAGTPSEPLKEFVDPSESSMIPLWQGAHSLAAESVVPDATAKKRAELILTQKIGYRFARLP